ncbi:MAG: 2-oxoacid:acceptor oxidoreductase family protein, partial [Hyphomicrobiales bacterium]
MNETSKPLNSVSFAIVGSGGAGALTAGAILLEATGKAGLYGFMNRSVGPQIRGGESAALVRLSTRPVDCMAETYNFVIAIDWRNADRFAAEMPLSGQGVAIGDPAAGEMPDAIAREGIRRIEIPLKEMAETISNGRENMIAAGIAAGIMGFSEDELMAVIETKLAGKGVEAIKAGRECIELGIGAGAGLSLPLRLDRPEPSEHGRWLITGNEAIGLGAVRGGIRFAAAYPITPATEVLEWLAPTLSKV